MDPIDEHERIYHQPIAGVVQAANAPSPDPWTEAAVDAARELRGGQTERPAAKICTPEELLATIQFYTERAKRQADEHGDLCRHITLLKEDLRVVRAANADLVGIRKKAINLEDQVRCKEAELATANCAIEARNRTVRDLEELLKNARDDVRVAHAEQVKLRDSLNARIAGEHKQEEMPEFPHLDIVVIHEPGQCHTCDFYPTLQKLRRAFSGSYSARYGWRDDKNNAVPYPEPGSPDPASEPKPEPFRGGFREGMCDHMRYPDGQPLWIAQEKGRIGGMEIVNWRCSRCLQLKVTTEYWVKP